MKRKCFLALAACLIMGLIGTQALAFSLGGYTGDIEFKFSDFTEGTLHNSNSDNFKDQNWDGKPDYGNADGISDTYSIFKVSTIKTPASQTLWFDTKDGEELVGIFYGIDDDWWSVDANTGQTEIKSIGGRIDFYLQDAGVFDPTSGPFATGYTGLYPTVGTDASSQSFLSADLVAGITSTNGDPLDDHITYRNTLSSSTTPFTGDGSFYMSVIENSGLYWDLFDTDGYGGGKDDSGNDIPISDLWAQFDSVSRLPTDPEYWKQYGFLATSEDPVRGRVPEPGVMLLLSCGLLGIGMIGRRKIKS